MTREETIIPKEDMLTTCGTELKIGTIDESKSFPLTCYEKDFIKTVWLKNKTTGLMKQIGYRRIELHRETHYFYSPNTQCWEEWSEELEKELLK